MLARDNPEMLDKKAKEIISQLDPMKMRRAGQLESLDFQRKPT